MQRSAEIIGADRLGLQASPAYQIHGQEIARAILLREADPCGLSFTESHRDPLRELADVANELTLLSVNCLLLPRVNRRLILWAKDYRLMPAFRSERKR